MRKKIIVKRKGQFYIGNSSVPFSGVIRLVDGKVYRYTLDGRKILLSKPKPDPQRIVDNFW